jgi:hypothetical protein
MNEPELKPCPFCGSTKLKVECKSVLDGYIGDIHRVKRMTFSVRCNKCHARGGAVGGRVIDSFRFSMTEKDLPEWATTDTWLKERAIEAWNRREVK